MAELILFSAAYFANLPGFILPSSNHFINNSLCLSHDTEVIELDNYVINLLIDCQFHKFVGIFFLSIESMYILPPFPPCMVITLRHNLNLNVFTAIITISPKIPSKLDHFKSRILFPLMGLELASDLF